RTQVARAMNVLRRVLRHAVQGSWFAAVLFAAPLGAQDAPRQQAGFDKPAGQEAKKVDIILPHISDSDELDVPWLNAQGFKAVHLPHWEPVKIGGYSLDLSPTKHVVMMLIAGVLLCIILINAARAQAKHTEKGQSPRGLSGTIEAMVLYIRNEVIL